MAAKELVGDQQNNSFGISLRQLPIPATPTSSKRNIKDQRMKTTPIVALRFDVEQSLSRVMSRPIDPKAMTSEPIKDTCLKVLVALITFIFL